MMYKHYKITRRLCALSKSTDRHFYVSPSFYWGMRKVDVHYVFRAPNVVCSDMPLSSGYNPPIWHNGVEKAYEAVQQLHLALKNHLMLGVEEIETSLHQMTKRPIYFDETSSLLADRSSVGYEPAFDMVMVEFTLKLPSNIEPGIQMRGAIVVANPREQKFMQTNAEQKREELVFNSIRSLPYRTANLVNIWYKPGLDAWWDEFNSDIRLEHFAQRAAKYEAEDLTERYRLDELPRD